MSEAALVARSSAIGMGRWLPSQAERTGLELNLEEIATAIILLFYGTTGYIPILMPTLAGAADNWQSSQVHAINHISLAIIWTVITVLIIKSWKRLRLRSWSAIFCLAFSFWGLSLLGTPPHGMCGGVYVRGSARTPSPRRTFNRTSAE